MISATAHHRFLRAILTDIVVLYNCWKALTLTKSILGGPNWAMYIDAEVRTCIQYGIYDDRSIT